MPRPLLLLAVWLVVLCAPAAAFAGGTGGASADSLETGALAVGTPPAPRPVARVFRVAPATLTEGHTPRISVRIDHPGAERVAARVVVLAATGRAAARIDLGRVRTGRTIAVGWPARTKLRAGRYVVRLHAKDPDGEVLARAARTTGKATLTVRRRPRPEKSQPAPQREPTPPAPAEPPASAPGSGVFPVAGSFALGGPDGSFGAGRPGRTHEGQDISAAAGVPVVAPVAGTIAFVDFQPGGAGQYVVLTAEDGRTMFFAHMQTGASVTPGQRVGAGTTLGRVGSTGASSGPHLHFEIWLGGWRHQGGKPIDPLPQLQAWAR